MFYFLSVGPGGRMFMSVLSPRLQIINGLPYLPKMEAKEALLVRGPWDETPGCHLMSTGLSLSQVCSWAGLGLPAYIPTFVVL